MATDLITFQYGDNRSGGMSPRQDGAKAMVNPNRRRGPYTVTIGGDKMRGPLHTVATIRAARAAAEEYGVTADWADVTDRFGRPVARFERDPNGTGGRWFRAEI